MRWKKRPLKQKVQKAWERRRDAAVCRILKDNPTMLSYVALGMAMKEVGPRPRSEL